MSISIKELIIVLGFSIPLFALAKPTALLFTEEGDFNRRRNIWLVLTITAFLSPNFWLFVAVGAPLLYWGGRKDTNPIAFYLLLMNIIPSVDERIPTILIKQLFDLNIFKLLSLCVLVPAALRMRKSLDPQDFKGMRAMDVALLTFGVLQVCLYVPPDLRSHIILHNSATNDLRSAFLFYIDIFVLYYVASRSCTDQRKLVDGLAAFCLSCSLMAIIAVFESLKHWLLYAEMTTRWGGNPLLSDYLIRGPFLRAQASSSQPMALGFLLVLAFGFWLYLGTHVRSRMIKTATTALLWLALLTTFSRGAWLAAIAGYFAYAAFRGGARLVKATFVFLLIAGALFASPLGDKIMGMLPFMGGHVGDNTLIYRERLFDRSWQLIQARPIFGDQLALSKMQDLRQGQGIIDIVNGYIEVTLFYGFTGLAVFLTFIFLGLTKAYRTGIRLAKNDSDTALLGAELAASIVAMLVLLADGSLGTGPQHIFYVVIGFAGAYACRTAARKFRPTDELAVKAPHTGSPVASQAV